MAIFSGNVRLQALLMPRRYVWWYKRAPVVKVNVSYLQPDPKTGILRYRRAFPVPLRPFVRQDGRPMTELKKSIGARSLNEPGAKARHDAIAAEYDAMVAKARKLAEGTFDELMPHLVTYLADNFLHCHLALDEASRWRQPPPEFPFETRRDYEEDYLECREMLSSYDADGLVDFWRDWAMSYTQALGYLFDPTTPAFASLCRELGEASCKLWLALDQRIDERQVATPEASVLPKAHRVEAAGTRAQQAAPQATVDCGRTFEAVALELIDNPRMGIREGVKEHVRTALRFIGETLGSPAPSELTQVAVGQLLDLMALRPVKLPKAEWAMSLPDLADL